VHTADGADDIWLTGDDTRASTPESGFDNPYMFTGRQWDGETGLYYYRARMYSPALGQRGNNR
jgi:RHS repeat-associated protein